MFDRTIKTMIFAAACIGLVACGDKPPDCADTKVLDRLREAIPRDAVKQISDNIEAAGNWKRPGAQQLRALLDGFGKDFLLNVPDYGFLLGPIGSAFDMHTEKAKASAAAVSSAPDVTVPATSVAGRSNACIDMRMAAWRKDFDGRQDALIAEAERENREFRPLSPMQEEESQAAALEQARKECP
jgi:hypothetical protein